MSNDRIIPAGTALLGVVSLVLWLTGSRVSGLEERRPEAEPDSGSAAPQKPSQPIAETATLEKSDGTPADLPGLWPSFRGPARDGVNRETVELARTWPEDGPEVLWSVDLGEGHAGAVVRDGRVYVLDYDKASRRDTLRCLSLADGKEIWRFSYPVDVKFLYGMSRTVPAVADGYVVTFGPKCHVACVDAKTGEFGWAFDLVREFGAHVPSWYAGQCPLIDRGRAIIAVGGRDVLMMAVDCSSDKIVWKTPNPKGWQMTHSSVVPMDFAGTRMYLYASSGGLVAVSADDGRVLWEEPRWKVGFANIPCPVPLGDGRIFLAGGYGAGSMMIRLHRKGGEFSTEVVFKLKEREFSAEQHSPIYHDGCVYAVRVDGQLACLRPSGEVLWSSGRQNRFGRGPFLMADGLMYVMNNVGVLHLLDVSPRGSRRLAQARVLPAADKQSWAPMALAGGRLIVRDLKTMKCLDVRRK